MVLNEHLTNKQTIKEKTMGTQQIKTGYGNESFAILKMMESAPSLGVIREAIRNSLDANATEVHLYAKQLSRKMKSKLVILDNGFGMGESTLKKLALINSLYDEEVNKSTTNFNSGIRIMGVPINELGLTFVSKHNGVIRSMKLGINDGHFLATYNDSPTGVDYGKDKGFKDSWTAVVFYGNSAEQDTFRNPFGRGLVAPLNELITNRFYQFYNHDGAEANVFLDGKEVIPSGNCPVNKQWIVRASGLKIVYKISDKGCVSGLLAEDEVYDMSKGTVKTAYTNNNNTVLGALGAFQLADKLSVLVELQESAYQHHQYRDRLLSPKAKISLSISDYVKPIKAKLPKELKDIIEALNNKTITKNNKGLNDALQKDLMKDLGLGDKGSKLAKDGDEVANIHEKVGGNGGGKGDKHPKPEVNRAKAGGLKNYTASFNDVIFEHDKKSLASVTGDNVYFNNRHPLFKYVESVPAIGVSLKIVQESFINFITDNNKMFLESDKETVNNTLIAVAYMTIATKAFELHFKKAVKKGA